MNQPPRVAPYFAIQPGRKIAVVLLVLAASFLGACATPRKLTNPHRLDIRLTHPGSFEASAMLLDGKPCQTIAELEAAVAALPRRSNLVWASGCIGFSNIPLGKEPRPTIEEFRKTCARHGVRFHYAFGYPSDEPTRRSFSVSDKILSAATQDGRQMDARAWLESQGVSFYPGCSAKWGNWKKTLVVKLDQAESDLVERILQAREAEVAPSNSAR